jgi:hypothetical protein
MLFDQLEVAQEKIEELNREQESLIDIFAEERDRRENEEKVLKKKLQVRCSPTPPPPSFYCFSFSCVGLLTILFPL